MKRLFLSLFLILPHAAPAADSAAGELWNKATAIFALQENLYPGTMSVRSEMLDRAGKTTSLTEMRFANVLQAGGEIRSELLSAFENGKDVTADRRKRMAEQRAEGGKRARFSFSDSPLNPKRQQQVTWSATEERAVLFGRTCRRFDFSYQAEMENPGKGEPLEQRGMVWIDEENGRPLKLEYTLAPLPKRVKKIWTVCVYETSAEAPCVLREVRVEGVGGILFIRKGFRMVTRFADFRPVKGGEG